MSSWERALVTGASSGIGREIARQLAAEGVDLVVVARDEKRLEALADELDVEVEVLVADLSDPDEVAVVGQRLAADDEPVDLLVNNAGFGQTGDFLDLDIDREGDVVGVNLVALHRLCHAAGAAMRARGGGGILNISSLASYLPAPGSATYAATKAFVTSFSESLHEELRPHGITVTVSCPGLTRTEFQERADADIDVPDFAWQSAEDCARESLRAVGRGRAKVITGPVNKALLPTISTAPSWLLRKAAGFTR